MAEAAPEPLRAHLEPSPTARGLLLLLHGHGDDPLHLVGTAHRLDPDRATAWLAPTGPTTTAGDGGHGGGGGGPAWFPSAPGDEGPPLGRALEALDEAVGRNAAGLGLPEGRTVVVGHSQGAAAALALAGRAGAPWRPRAVVAVAAWLPSEPDVAWDLPAAAGVPFCLVHGAADEVVDVRQGRAAARALERAGADVRWVEHGGGHEVPRSALADVRAWLAPLL